MRNKSILSFLILTLSLSLTLIGSVFGQVADEAFALAPEASSTLVISQAYGGGGSNTSATYFNDYVEIRNFDPAIDTISGGVNIRAVNNPLTNQTFLGSGVDLIAKIGGLWMGNPNFQFSVK